MKQNDELLAILVFKGLRPTRRPQNTKNIKKYFLQNLILIVLEPRDYQNLLGHVI